MTFESFCECRGRQRLSQKSAVRRVGEAVSCHWANVRNQWKSNYLIEDFSNPSLFLISETKPGIGLGTF